MCVTIYKGLSYILDLIYLRITFQIEVPENMTKVTSICGFSFGNQRRT